MRNKSNRLVVLRLFIIWFFASSFLLRVVLLLFESSQLSSYVSDTVKTFVVGFFFDLGTIALISTPAVIYFAVLPNRFIGRLFDKIMVWTFSTLTIFILTFTFFAEITFWEEFHSRFNFIAVDYLIYTHEVVANIQESYPLPILIIGIVSITLGIVIVFLILRAYDKTFKSSFSIRGRIASAVLFLSVSSAYIFYVDNSMAEWSSNRYHSEISKSGIYSFFAAFRNNQMKYPDFYTKMNDKAAFDIVRYKLKENDSRFEEDGNSISREITSGTGETEKNVVFILIESFSADFMAEFGNQKNLTPFLDSLAQKSIFFKNMYATGTRTIRGMEAVTLSIPPTPGQSIVKRPDNTGLYTIANVFEAKGYERGFFYGGDGYFDNMNDYFGGNGFNIYDRGHGSILSDNIGATRTNIEDEEVTFENAWGICDEDIYAKMLKQSDAFYKQGKKFFNFVMTTSNHRPYTYPSGKIDIPSGTSRDGAVQYTDYALKELFRKLQKKPWYKDTVFIIIADHCASSAGKNEIDVANYRIPAFIVNMPGSESRKVLKQCSQIDIFPTFFSLANWSYRSNFFGKNVLNPKFEERAFVSTYRKLGLMKGNEVMILSDHFRNAFYDWNESNNSLTAKPVDSAFLIEAISWYQTADYLFTNKKLK